MNKLIDHTFNYLRVALLGVVVAFLIIGPNAAAANLQNAQVNDTKLWIPTDPMYSIETANYSPVLCYTLSTYDIGASIGNALAGYFDCVISNSAQCGLLKGGICTVASAVIVTALYVLASKAAAAALASQIALKLGAKKSVKHLVEKLKNIIYSWGITSVEIAGQTVTIPWTQLATLLDNDSKIAQALDFIMLNDWSKAKRLCKCLIC